MLTNKQKQFLTESYQLFDHLQFLNRKGEDVIKKMKRNILHSNKNVTDVEGSFIFDNFLPIPVFIGIFLQSFLFSSLHSRKQKLEKIESGAFAEFVKSV